MYSTVSKVAIVWKSTNMKGPSTTFNTNPNIELVELATEKCHNVLKTTLVYGRRIINMRSTKACNGNKINRSIKIGMLGILENDLETLTSPPKQVSTKSFRQPKSCKDRYRSSLNTNIAKDNRKLITLLATLLHAQLKLQK